MSTDTTTAGPAERAPTRTVPGHGTLARYRGSKSWPSCAAENGGRACEACRRANRERPGSDPGVRTRYEHGRRNQRKAELRAQRVPLVLTTDGVSREALVHPDPPSGHGSITARTNTTCQCSACLSAHRLGRNLTAAELRAFRDELAAIATALGARVKT